MDDIMENQLIRCAIGYIIFFTIGFACLVVAMFVNEDFCRAALYMMDHHAIVAAFMSLIVLPIVGAIIVLAVVLLALSGGGY